MARISIQDIDAKVVHTPPNERDGIVEEEAVEDEDAESVTGTSSKRVV